MPSPARDEAATVPVASHGWRGRAARDWAHHFRDADPLDWAHRHHAQPVNDRPVVRTWCLVVGKHVLYLKHFAGPRDAPGLLDRLRWQVHHRARRIARTTDRLRAAGFHAPRTILVARRRRGLAVEQLLITEQMPGRPCAKLLRDPDPARAHAVARAAGDTLARLHNAGYVHGEPHLANLQLTADGQIGWLDNDRTRRRPLLNARYVRWRNLTRMLRDILRARGERTTLRCFLAYARARGLSRRQRRDTWRQLQPQLRAQVRRARQKALRDARAARSR